MSESEAENGVLFYRTAFGQPLIPGDIAGQLMANWRALERHRKAVSIGEAKSADSPIEMPLAKLVRPGGRFRCLISRIDPDDACKAYGLTDSGTGLPEIGPIDLEEIASWRTGAGPAIERDPLFKPRRSLFLYWEAWRDEALSRKASDELNDAGSRQRQIKPIPQSLKKGARETAAGRKLPIGNLGGGGAVTSLPKDGAIHHP